MNSFNTGAPENSGLSKTQLEDESVPSSQVDEEWDLVLHKVCQSNPSLFQKVGTKFIYTSMRVSESMPRKQCGGLSQKILFGGRAGKELPALGNVMTRLARRDSNSEYLVWR